ATGIAIDSGGNAYLSGVASANGMAAPSFTTTAGALQTSPRNNNYTGFVAEVNAQATQQLYGSFLGGSVSDWASGIAGAPTGAAVTVGWTSSPSNFPLASAYQSMLLGPTDAFVTRMRLASGQSPLFSTYLGGGALGPDQAYAVAFDPYAGLIDLTGS